jgi:hypothetical protein
MPPLMSEGERTICLPLRAEAEGTTCSPYERRERERYAYSCEGMGGGRRLSRYHTDAGVIRRTGKCLVPQHDRLPRFDGQHGGPACAHHL